MKIENQSTEPKDGGWGEIINLGPHNGFLGGPSITVENLYQSFKKRLMKEVVPGMTPFDETGESSAILKDKP